MPLKAVVCDYGGVLTNPLDETFAAFEAATGIGQRQIAEAMRRAAERDGEPPMAALECGRISESDFLERLVSAGEWTPEQIGRLRGFRATWFAGRVANDRFVDYLRTLPARGLTLALLTNNVREWEPLWRATIPFELFDVIVNSADEGVRKPEPEIYERLITRLGLDPAACLLVDDLEENCHSGRAAGLLSLRFSTTDAAIAEIERRLAC